MNIGHAGRGGGDRLQEAGAVEAADGAEQLSLGDRFARPDDRLPPAFVLAAQPQERWRYAGCGPGAAGWRVGHAERREDPVEPADVASTACPLDQAAAAGLGGDRGDARRGGGRAGGAADRAAGARRLADDVAEPVGDGQLAGPVLGRARVVQRERLQRLNDVAAVRVDEGVGTRDQLGERRRTRAGRRASRPGRRGSTG